MTYGFYPKKGYNKSLSGQGIMGENGGMHMICQQTLDNSPHYNYRKVLLYQKNIKVVGTI